MQLTGFQQFALIALRTAIGWHFAYEGFYKLMLPGWTRSGERIAAFSAAGYLKGATGPLAPMFHSMAAHASTMHAIDLIVPIGLLLVGLSLMLGLFTQLGCLGAMAFLALFYVSQPPMTGMPAPGAEGENLIVNKNLIELIAVFALFYFRTGSIAGLDRLWSKSASARAQPAVGVAGVDSQRP
jgi:thiosulfate dehydrogenase [quinone] large subunit